MTDSLTVRDNRTGDEYELPITDGTVSAADVGKIGKTGRSGHRRLRPGLHQHRVVPQPVTYIDGDDGILEYRGYPIEQLAE